MARYTAADLDRDALEDLRVDARVARRYAQEARAANDWLRAIEQDAYAAKCEAAAARYANGGAHNAIMRGKV